MKNTYYIILLFSLLVISCEQDISVSPNEIEPTKAYLYVNSYPKGAMIYKNGRYTGKRTPDTLKFLDFGVYQIKLRMDYFRDTAFTANIYEEKVEQTFIDYSKNISMLGTIYCTSVPSNAKVYINDSLTSLLTPSYTKKLLPGIYKVKYSYPEHRDAEVEVIVRSNVAVRAAKTLQDTSIWVDYNIDNMGLPQDYINCIKIDKNNVKWLGMDGMGLVRFDEKTITTYFPPLFPIPSGVVYSMDIDNENNLWMATAGGVARFDGYNWNAYRSYNSPIPTNYINDVKCEKNSNYVWIATNSGLVRFDKNEDWRIYAYDSVNTTYPEGGISTLEIDANNNKWIGTDSYGVYYLKDTVFHHMSYETVPNNNFLSDGVLFSSLAPNGNLWLAHASFRMNRDLTLPKGLSCFDGNHWTLYPNPFSYNILYQIYVDQRGVVWICTDNGLYRKEGSSNFTVYNNSNSGIMENTVKDIVRDSKGIIWIATGGGGLIKYKGEMVKR